MQDDSDNERWGDRPNTLDEWQQRRQLRRQCRQAPAPRLFFAILLIAAGALLFLSNLGLLPEFNIWQLWPAIFIVAGIGKLVSDSRRSGQAFGIILIAGGSLFTLVNLGILQVRSHDTSWPLSLLLMTVGALALVKVLERSDYPRPNIGSSQRDVASADVLNEQVIFGSLKRKIESTSFRGGKLDAVFGGMDINLRQAQISSPERSATLEVNVIFGGIELRVPQTWRVVAQTTGIFGSVEDKTTANKLPGFDGPTLFLTGAAIFGGVEIKD